MFADSKMDRLHQLMMVLLYEYPFSVDDETYEALAAEYKVIWEELCPPLKVNFKIPLQDL